MRKENEVEKEIIKLITVLAEDNLYRQVYAMQIKRLFDMLKMENETSHCRNEDLEAPVTPDRWMQSDTELLDTLQAECDRTQNEGGRLLLDWYRKENIR